MKQIYIKCMIEADKIQEDTVTLQRNQSHNIFIPVWPPHPQVQPQASLYCIQSPFHLQLNLPSLGCSWHRDVQLLGVSLLS